MHSLHGLRRDSATNINHLLGILHLKLKPSHNPSHRTSQLGPRKVLPNTRSLSVQKGDLRKVGRCASVVIDRGLTGLVGVDPSLGDEILARLAPEFWAAVDGVWAEDNFSAFRDMFSCYSGVADGFTDS